MKAYLKVLYFLVLMFSSINALSQKTFVSVGGNAVVPKTFGIKMVAGTGIGGSLRLETRFGKRINGIATVEYLKFAEKKSAQSTAKFTAIPVQIGIKYYAIGKENTSEGLFISGEAGIMRTTTFYTYTSGNPDFNFKESGLCVAPGVGYQLGRVEASFRPKFNLSASGFNVYYLNYRLAYAFRKRINKD